MAILVADGIPAAQEAVVDAEVGLHVRPQPAVTLSRKAAGILLGLYLLAVASVVLWPTDWVYAISLRQLRAVKEETGAPHWLSSEEVGFAANVLLFMPLSFLGSRLALAWRWTAWLLAGLGAAAAIETAQMVFLSARHPDVEDVVANTVGTVMGYLFAALFLRTSDARDSRFKPGGRDKRGK